MRAASSGVQLQDIAESAIRAFLSGSAAAPADHGADCPLIGASADERAAAGVLLQLMRRGSRDARAAVLGGLSAWRRGGKEQPAADE